MNHSALEKIRAYHPLNERITTAGQPTAEQFNIIKLENFDLVINLALPDSPGAIVDEFELMNQLGMEYIHIPVDFTAPSISDLYTFFATLDQYHDRRIFIHCALNKRVSVFMYLYRRIRQHVPDEEALPDLLSVWKPDLTWQRFMESALASMGKITDT